MEIINKNGNLVIGTPKYLKSEIVFEGTGNILWFENDNICLENSKIVFKGTNSVCAICNSKYNVKIRLTLYNDSLVYIGKDVAMNNFLEILCSEAKNVIIGDDCLVSSQCIIRTSDAHSIFDIKTNRRINIGRSVFIGDHCWLAARAVILKGSKLHSGTIIGSDAVVAGKETLSNTVWGGNPAKLLKEDVYYDKRGTHGLRFNDLENSMLPNEKIKDLLYFTQNGELDFADIDEQILCASTAQEKLDKILNIMSNQNHNRFARF